MILIQVVYRPLLRKPWYNLIETELKGHHFPHRGRIGQSTFVFAGRVTSTSHALYTFVVL